LNNSDLSKDEIWTSRDILVRDSQNALADMVTEVIHLKPDVILVTSTRLLFVFKEATTTIPVVGLMADPVRLGLVANLARPGGNITGVTTDPGIEFFAKRFELLKQAAPKVSKLDVLVNQFAMQRSVYGAVMKEAERVEARRIAANIA
jgi:putative ABC transport system substrate-binding protein